MAALGVLIFSLYQVYGIMKESRANNKLNEQLIDEAVVMVTPDPGSESEITEEPIKMQEQAPIEVDFSRLWSENEDIIGWLYCEDTPINLPIVQAEDNDRYLRRLIDGSWNMAGTLFADYRNSSEFSDWNTVVYGHNMKNDSMFGTLPNYKSQEYYDVHPIMWLLTPTGDYKIELVAGYVTPTTSDVYSFGQSEEAVFSTVQQIMEKSTFTTDAELTQEDRFLTLSTCSYEYNNARYVLIGRLIPLV